MMLRAAVAIVLALGGVGSAAAQAQASPEGAPDAFPDQMTK